MAAIETERTAPRGEKRPSIAHLALRFEHAVPRESHKSEVEYITPRRDFWRHLPEVRHAMYESRSTGSRDSSELSRWGAADTAITIAEARIRSSFGPKLGEEVAKAIPASKRSARVSFTVTTISYGSIELGLLAHGLNDAADVLGWTLPICIDLLGAYAGAPLQELVGSGPFTVDVIDAGDLGAALAPAPAPAPAAAAAMEGDTSRAAVLRHQLNRTWIVANTSLIPAVAIVAYFLYLGWNSIEAERVRLDKHVAELGAREAALIDAYGKRDHDIDSVLIEVVRSAASAATARPACCCAPTRPAPPQPAASAPPRLCKPPAAG